jgi:hypothetical protein
MAGVLRREKCSTNKSASDMAFESLASMWTDADVDERYNESGVALEAFHVRVRREDY